MIELTVDPRNKRVNVRIENISQDSSRGIREGFYRLGKRLVRDTSKDILRKPRQGRLYRVRLGPKRVIRHKASVPGEAPANITGKLRRSLGFIVQGFSKMEFGYKQDYGKFLENGTKRIKPRPGLLINIKRNLSVGAGYFEAGIRRNLRRR